MARHTIYLDQGTDFTVHFTWQNEGSPVDITGYSAALQVRSTVDSETVVIKKTDMNGIALGGAAGTIAVTFNNVATSALAGSSFVYDLELTAPGGDVSRVIQGPLFVTK
jgi:hypothetical protein